MLDKEVLEAFKQRAAIHGLGYQTEINLALRQLIEQEPLEDIIRRVVRDELNLK